MMRKTAGRGFTLIEMLTVMGILMLVMALALPNFLEMMKNRNWQAAVGAIQAMVMRARATATNVRIDMAVEFYTDDNGTVMWLESENNQIERTPDLLELQRMIGGSAGIRYFLSTFQQAGGSYKSGYKENTCTKCGKYWQQTGGSVVCPQCGNTGSGGDWATPVISNDYYYDFQINPANASSVSYGDNAYQTDEVKLAGGIVIWEEKCRDFINWDAKESVECYGYDDTRDIRVGVNGSLVQSRDPVIALREKRTENWRSLQVVRCTGRVIKADEE